MPIPRVFISSTCYDLKYIRENLKFFTRNFGYEPILSEEGNVFYDPSLNVQEACIAEVPSCQMLVLVIGGRFGGRYQDTDKSITNTEYLQAVKHKIPIFALVEQGVYEQYHVYNYNRDNKGIDPELITYPSVDSNRIFEFISEVQTQAINNALVPFSDFQDIQDYLKQQWAGMMFRFLNSESETRRVEDLFGTISDATKKIEFLTRQVVNSVADPITKLNVEFYDYLVSKSVVHDLASWDLRPSPKKIIASKTFDAFCGNQVEPNYDEEGSSITYGGPPYRLSGGRYKTCQNEYQVTRKYLLAKLKEARISSDDFVEGCGRESSSDVSNENTSPNETEDVFPRFLEPPVKVPKVVPRSTNRKTPTQSS